MTSDDHDLSAPLSHDGSPAPTHRNIYRNTVTGATPTPLMPTPDAVDEEFITGANRVLEYFGEEYFGDSALIACFRVFR